MAKLMFQTSLAYVFQPQITHRNPTVTIVPESFDFFAYMPLSCSFCQIGSSSKQKRTSAKNAPSYNFVAKNRIFVK